MKLVHTTNFRLVPRALPNEISHGGKNSRHDVGGEVVTADADCSFQQTSTHRVHYRCSAVEKSNWCNGLHLG